MDDLFKLKRLEFLIDKIGLRNLSALPDEDKEKLKKATRIKDKVEELEKIKEKLERQGLI